MIARMQPARPVAGGRLVMAVRPVILCCTLVPLAIAGAGPAVAEPPARRPNILFILADDQAYDTIQALGAEGIETPHLDRLVRRGTSFSRAYNQGSWHGAVCVASRTMLVTGRSLWRARDEEPRLKANPAERAPLWPTLLGRAGYDTYFSGKWHVAADVKREFGTVRHVRPGMPNQTPQGYDRPRAGQPDPWSPSDPALGGYWEGGRHWSEVLADDAEAFFNQAAGSDRPFFMMLAFNAPHDPRQAPAEFVNRYPPERIRLPEPFLAEYPFEIGSNRIRDERLAPFPRTEQAVRVHRAEYHALVAHLDAQVGRILAALDRSGRVGSTLVCFTSDHGLACGHHGLLGKQNMFEHSVRVPFILAGPGVAAGRRIDAPIYLQDIVPTTLALAGAEVPEHVEFKSLVPLLDGTAERIREAAYAAYMQFQRMVTEDNLKLIVYPKLGRELLFDLAADPHETRDLAASPGHAADLARLRHRLAALQQELGDPLAEAEGRDDQEASRRSGPRRAR